MNEFGERLRAARTLRGLSQVDLATHAGSSRSMISSYEAGARSPKGATLLGLARALRVSAQWLMNGEGPMETIEPLATQDALLSDATWVNDSRGHFARPFRAIPLLRRIDSVPVSGDMSIVADLLENCLPIDDRLSSQLGPRAFAVYVSDQAMRPVALAGDIAIADPDIAPSPGNLVIAQDQNDQEFIVRRYKQSSDGGRLIQELVPEGKYWPPLRAEGPISIVGTVKALLLFTYDYRDFL
jgi:transcriptional regulator with XRE-family HTH domain